MGNVIENRGAAHRLDIRTAFGVPFGVLADFTTGEGEGLVEFYDLRYPGLRDEEPGQFTGARYYVTTLLGEDGCGTGTGGLCLSGGITAWTIDAVTMDEVRGWLRTTREEK